MKSPGVGSWLLSKADRDFLVGTHDSTGLWAASGVSAEPADGPMNLLELSALVGSELDLE